MRNWEAFVRERLAVPGLTAGREARIVREIAVQLEDFYRDALARGLAEPDADAHARAQITDWDRLAADVRSAHGARVRSALDGVNDALEGRVERRGGGRMLADLWGDVRYALRGLAKTPGFTATAMFTLALAIGGATAIFSVVNGVLLRPLPFPAPDGLVVVYEVVPQYGRFSVAPASFLDWRRRNTVFERIAAFNNSGATLRTDSGPERLTNALVSWDLFDLLRVHPILGRGFTAEEDAPGKDNVIVLGHGAWQRRFGGDPRAVGRSVTINGAPVTIVGVMPAGFAFPAADTEFWRPLAIEPARATRGGHFLGVAARMKPGVSVQQADAEMKTIAEQLAVEYPDSSAKESAVVLGLHERIVGDVRPALLTLLAAVGVVVVIACANVANLLLVRASARDKEIAIRTALGAGRGRLVQQMLTESLILALGGGLLGAALAYLAIAPIQTLSAGGIPRVAEIAVDARVLGFALITALVTGATFGLAPAWRASRGAVGEILKESGRSSSASGGRAARNSLLIAEVALSIVLLVVAALLLRSFTRLTNVDPGFVADNVLTFRVGLPATTYAEDHQRARLFNGVIAKLESAPHVSAAAMVQTLPLKGDYTLSFAIQGRPPSKPGEEPSANYRVVSPRYFETLAIPLLRGRAFDPRDAAKAPLVAVVDETFARRYFPGEDALGRGLDIGKRTDGFYTIVGVVGDVRHDGLDSAADPTMYVPFEQDVFSTMWVVARSRESPSQLATAARAAVHELDPALAPYSMGLLADVVSESVARRRFSMLLLGVFAGSALFLAAIGLYGVVAYTVSLRTQEIGLRMAIGAQQGDVLRLVVGGGMRLVLVGAAIGLVAALATARLAQSLLFSVTPFDPVSYGATIALLLAVGALACYAPARRAARVDPINALRQE